MAYPDRDTRREKMRRRKAAQSRKKPKVCALLKQKLEPHVVTMLVTAPNNLH